MLIARLRPAPRAAGCARAGSCRTGTGCGHHCGVVALARGGLQRPGRIGQVRACDRAQVRASGGDDGVDVVGLVDVADRHGGDADLVADLVGERRLPHAPVHRLLPRHGLPGGDVDEIGAGVLEGAHDAQQVRLAQAAVGPVARRDAHRQRLVGRPCARARRCSTSSGKRRRFSMLPPYSSRALIGERATGRRPAGSRAPCAARACRSRPRARARAARTNSSRTLSMSARRHLPAAPG